MTEYLSYLTLKNLVLSGLVFFVGVLNFSFVFMGRLSQRAKKELKELNLAGFRIQRFTVALLFCLCPFLLTSKYIFWEQ